MKESSLSKGFQKFYDDEGTNEHFSRETRRTRTMLPKGWSHLAIYSQAWSGFLDKGRHDMLFDKQMFPRASMLVVLRFYLDGRCHLNLLSPPTYLLTIVSTITEPPHATPPSTPPPTHPYTHVHNHYDHHTV